MTTLKRDLILCAVLFAAMMASILAAPNQLNPIRTGDMHVALPALPSHPGAAPHAKAN